MRSEGRVADVDVRWSARRPDSQSVETVKALPKREHRLWRHCQRAGRHVNAQGRRQDCGQWKAGFGSGRLLLLTENYPHCAPAISSCAADEFRDREPHQRAASA